jgi:pimeloyl-ACP methyl ester carboxylesterase
MSWFTQAKAVTQYAESGGIRFAYGASGSRPTAIPGCPTVPPLVFFQHFMGTLDDYDPAISDAFAGDREVILFNNGHPMGGLVAQEVALARPDLVRRLMLAGTGPRGGEGIGALPAWVAAPPRTPATPTSRASGFPSWSSTAPATS